MFDAIFGKSVKILKILAKVQCVLAFVLASMLCGAVHEMLKPFSRFSAIVLGLVVAVVFWVLQMFLAWGKTKYAHIFAASTTSSPFISASWKNSKISRNLYLKKCLSDTGGKLWYLNRKPPLKRRSLIC